MIKTLFRFIIIAGISSCATRISRPHIVGSVVNNQNDSRVDSVSVISYDKNGKSVTECITSENGRFYLKQEKYWDKLAIGGEAPMEYYSFTLQKQGFYDREIESRSNHSFGHDTIFYDTIYIKPIQE